MTSEHERINLDEVTPLQSLNVARAAIARYYGLEQKIKLVPKNAEDLKDDLIVFLASAYQQIEDGQSSLTTMTPKAIEFQKEAYAEVLMDAVKFAEAHGVTDFNDQLQKKIQARSKN